jgi:hypothetical protein
MEVEVVPRHPRFLQIVVQRLCLQLPYPEEPSLPWFFMWRFFQRLPLHSFPAFLGIRSDEK